MGIKTSIHDKASIVRSVVFSANDGVVTTFAVVAGSMGASLSPTIVLILGFANLFADGLSMSTSAYLGIESEIEYEEKVGEKIKVGSRPLKNAIVTFVSFILTGFVPLFPYVFKLDSGFIVSSLLVAASLLLIGILRGVCVGKNRLKAATENLLIGGLAAAVAYIVGYLVERYII